MQAICTLLQTDNHTNTSSVNVYRPDAESTEGKCSNVEKLMNIYSQLMTGELMRVLCWFDTQRLNTVHV